MLLCSRWSVRTQLLILVIIAIFPALGIILYSGVEQRHFKEEDIRRSSFSTMQAIANRQEVITESTRQLLITLSKVPEVQRMDAPACDALFKHLLPENPIYTNIFLLNEKGILLSSVLPSKHMDFSDRKYFKDALSTRGFSTGEYLVARISGTPVFTFSYPVIDRQGQFKGVLSVAMNLQRYDHVLAEARLPDKTSVVLADHKFIRIYFYPEGKRFVGHPLLSDHINLASVVADEGGVSETGVDGVRRFYTFKKLRLSKELSPYLYLLVGIPEEESLTAIWSVTRKNLYLLGIVFVFAFLSAWYLGSYLIANPMNKLVAVTNRFRRGARNIRTGLPHTDNELGRLAKAFDEMAADLKNQENDQERMEEALRQSEMQFRSLADSAPDAIFVQSAGRFVYVNAAMLRLVGASDAGQLLGKDFTERMAPEYLERIRERIRFQRETGEPAPLMEQEYLRLDGLRVPVETTAVAIKFEGKAANLVFIRDITERRQAAQDLRESEERFRLAVESAPDAIYARTADWRFAYLNPAAVRLFGAESAEQLIGTPVKDRIDPSELDMVMKRVNLLNEGKDVPLIEQNFVRVDGSLVPVEVSAVSFQVKGANGALVFIRDIAKRKRAEALLRDSEAGLRQMQKLEAIGTLAGGIAHDFNNILGIVLGYTEMAMQDTEELPDVQSNLEQVHTAGIRAQDLVKQILTFSRQSEQEKKIISISPLIKEAVKMLRATIPTSIKIGYEIPKTSAILAAPSQVHQIIMNLVTNASHALQERTDGEIFITIEDQEIDDTVASMHPDLEPGSYAVLKVRDNGTGIPMEIIDKIFDPFFTTKEPGKGTGMGLAVVHGIVKSHGGAIIAQSRAGKGTTFTVYFPALEKNIALPEPKPEVAVTGSGHILFVDDEEALVAIGTRMLERLGYSVDGRTSSREALEAFRADSGKYDLVITDYTMPGMHGLALGEALMHIRPDIPVILCTGFGDLLTSEKATAVGIRELIMKPVVRSKLAGVVSKLLTQ